MKNYDKELHKANPIFTDEILDLLWSWIEEKQRSKLDKYLEKLRDNQEFSNLLNDITHLRF